MARNNPRTEVRLNSIALGLIVAGFLTLCGASIVAAGETPAPSTSDGIDWAKEREFWSFRTPVAQAQPVVKNKSWPRQPLDYFILARLEQKGVSPSSEADKRTLIRRATFDLAGLPPTPAEIDAFLKDRSRDAYEHLIDRLLGSTRFGERLASVWLPLARYAEDQAHQVGADVKSFYPYAFKYREWVINAFNRDLPYDQFVKLQIAADKFEPGKAEDLAALGFIGLGPKYYNRNRLDVMAEEWEDRVDTVSRSFLGLTVACARCHDHKFDPITMKDYYALAGIFASTTMVNHSDAAKSVQPILADAKTAEVKAADVKAAGAKAAKAAPVEMPADTLHIVEDGEAQNLNVFLRGNVDRKGPVVERRFLQVLAGNEPAAFKDGSGRRELAEAIASPHNPLTSRVIVNRVFGTLTGRPLVATPSNFGHSGEKPSHPELLDDLAVRFMAGGWSVKTLVREIMLSATYRQASLVEPRKQVADPGNELFSRMNRRRLTVEQWRDSVLYVADDIDLTGGKSMELRDPANHHRTVYARISRQKLDDLLIQFDYPDANVHAEKRAVTTTAIQKLFMLNSSFMFGQSKALSDRLNADPKASEKSRIQKAYELLYGREPESAEVKLALDFLHKPAAPEMSRWEEYAQLLLASNELMYVD